MRAALALALRAGDVPAATATGLFTDVLASDDDPALVAQAMRRFGPAATDAALAKAIADPRPAVAAAARDVQAARSPGK